MAKKNNKQTLFPKPEQSLVEINKLVNFIATQIGVQSIEKLNWTEKQKAVWVLCSGKLTREQLAQKSGVHLNTVKSFVEKAMIYGLLEEEKSKGGHPKRVIDYVPLEWKNYIKKEKVVREAEKTEVVQAKPEESKGGESDGKETV
jgi:hypothetical protein